MNRAGPRCAAACSASPRLARHRSPRRIDDALLSGGELAVSTQDRSEGTMVQLDGALMFAIFRPTPWTTACPRARRSPALPPRAAAGDQGVAREP